MKENWEVKKLGEVLQETETINPTQNPNKEFIYIDVSSVNNENFSIENTTLLKGKDAPSRARKLVKTNDVIFATVRPTLRRICIITDEYDNQVCSTGYFVLRVKENLNYTLLFYYLLTDTFNKRMHELQKGTSYPAVTNSDVREQIIVYPKSLSEQQRIISILDETFAAIDKAKENAEKNLQNSRELFDSYLKSVFANTGDGWERKKLGKISVVNMGQSPKGSSYNTTGDGVPLINGPVEFGGDDPFSKTLKTKFTTEPTKMCKQGDLILCVRGSTTGRMNIAGFDSCIGRGVASISSAEYQDWINQYINFNRETIYKLGTGATFPNVSSSTLSNLLIPIPPKEQQRSIVAKLEALSSETKRLEAIYQQKLAALDELKKSVLQKAFNGELAGA